MAPAPHKPLLFRALSSVDNAIQCLACSHACVLGLNEFGQCGVRQNQNGTLRLLVDGIVAASHLDPIEKKPFYHVLPGQRIFSIGTVGCNFRCLFCQNWEISQLHHALDTTLSTSDGAVSLQQHILSYGSSLSPQQIVEYCRKKRISLLAFTYNEPTIFFEYAYATASLAHQAGIKTVFVSNGYLTSSALETIRPYLDAINIDLKSFRDDFYKTYCNAHLAPVLATIQKAHALGIWVEVTTLLIPSLNDSDKEILDLANFLAALDINIPWHLTAFYPSYKMSAYPPTPYRTLLRAYSLGKKAGLRYVYLGNCRDVQRSSTFCHSCNAMLIQRDGYHVNVLGIDHGSCIACGQQIPGIWQ
ncbi:MAG: AmmeMemoRadiSam system radical SAM enzyme [Candidatus Woesearchaeota archaeon]